MYNLKTLQLIFSMKKGFLLPSKNKVYWKGGGGLALPMIQIGNIFYDLRTEGLKNRK